MSLYFIVNFKDILLKSLCFLLNLKMLVVGIVVVLWCMLDWTVGPVLEHLRKNYITGILPILIINYSFSYSFNFSFL